MKLHQNGTASITIPVCFAPAVRFRVSLAALPPGSALTEPSKKISGGLNTMAHAAANDGFRPVGGPATKDAQWTLRPGGQPPPFPATQEGGAA
jgi:hypothetical protein